MVVSAVLVIGPATTAAPSAATVSPPTIPSSHMLAGKWRMRERTSSPSPMYAAG